MITIRYNGEQSDEIRRYCARRLLKFEHGGEGRISIYSDGIPVVACDTLGQLDEILHLSNQRLFPTLTEVGQFLVKGAITALGFIAIEFIHEKMSK
jgi:hypothetical protein